ncbi:hypothetical protein SKAU_G00184540 [Synaphobranchus kaupii]|uniref:Osteopetrosis associated transmembrane protein 1 n=1 Tax=Synaphobranchus kaupii TaxID=118154 RepID=A0A9Q1IWU0_SYNKA|nr:hypothetical protein SKAU_G00184540 [Synaphobranchus kaupii]
MAGRAPRISAVPSLEASSSEEVKGPLCAAPKAACLLIILSVFIDSAPLGQSPCGAHSIPSTKKDLEVSDYCRELLNIFAQRYVLYVNCLVSSARPVKVCQNCYIQYRNLKEIYNNISSDQMGPSNVSCKDNLLRSDRLMLVFVLFENLQDIWTLSDCNQCLAKDLHSLTNDTLYYMEALNQSLSCFEKHQQQGNHSELCKDCKKTYKSLNELYSRMDINKTLCIDIEDAMNMTRRLWSKNFNCSFPLEETVPVIAVSSFMLFLPVIFYLSSFLHSEQKKRKLIHPKRAKSSNSMVNIQDKYS